MDRDFHKEQRSEADVGVAKSDDLHRGVNENVLCSGVGLLYPENSAFLEMGNEQLIFISVSFFSFGQVN